MKFYSLLPLLLVACSDDQPIPVKTIPSAVAFETKNVFIPEYIDFIEEGSGDDLVAVAVRSKVSLDDYCKDGWEVKSSRRAWHNDDVLASYVLIMAKHGLDIRKEKSEGLKKKWLDSWKDVVRPFSWGQEVVLQRRVPAHIEK